ncbi:hypothetical protein QAD02_023796, partial [Eretmocerus hayati]
MAFLRVISLVCLLSLSEALSTTIKLSSGYEMPSMAFCPWLIETENVADAVTTALNSGYRHIDTHYFLGHERYIAQAIKKYIQNGGKREDLFITTRTPIFANRASDVEKYLKLSLEYLEIDYIDMYCLMEPWAVMKDPVRVPANDAIIFLDNGTIALDYEVDHIATWKALESQLEAGLVRSIGLHDFNVDQTLNVINNCNIKPSYLSMEGQLYNQPNELHSLCKEHNIAIGVLGFHGVTPVWEPFLTKKYMSLQPVQENPIVKDIAKNHGKTAIQVLTRHLLQEGYILLLIGMQQPELIKEIFASYDFELTQNELEQLDGLNKGEDGRLISDFNLPG